MKKWQTNPLNSLEPDEVESDFKKMFGISTKLTNRFEQAKMNKPKAIASQIKTTLQGFRTKVPIIRALCNVGLQQRHNEQICLLIDKKLEKGEKLQDCNLNSLNIKDEFKAALEDISDKASKEYSNYNTMKKMEEEWQPLEFTCIEVEGKDSCILAGEAIELIQTTLDDHIIKT